MSDEGEDRIVDPGQVPWPQRVLDNLWLLVVISVVVPALLYLGWGLWELAELPSWGGGR